jgi:hypothetical protein
MALTVRLSPKAQRALNAAARRRRMSRSDVEFEAALGATARCAHCRPLVPSVVPRFAIGFAFVAARPDEIEALLDQLMPDIAFP